MFKQEEPLNEVSLNTPAGKPSVPMFQAKLTHTSESNVRMRDVGQSLDFLSRLLKDKKSTAIHKTVISDCLSNLYRELKRTHMVHYLKTLTKQHLVFVVNLFNDEDALGASLEILHLYNENNPFPVVDLHGVLLADYTFCNISHLSTLKILAMQAILKLKSCDEYEKSLLQIFSNDERYLLKGNNLKIHTLVKLVLHFYSVFSSSKVLFGLKFLHYMKRYNMEPGCYIKNMEANLFEQQLLRYVPVEGSINYRMFLNSFYMQYTKFKETPEKLMLTDLLPRSKSSPLRDAHAMLNLANENGCDKIWANLLATNTQNLIVIMTKALQKKEQQSVLKSLSFIYQLLRTDRYSDTKAKRSLFDKSLLFVNSHLLSFESCREEVLNLMKIFYEYCIDQQEFERLTNVINTLFNCSVVLKDFQFLKLAARLEVSRYYVSGDLKLIRPTLRRFEKFMSSSSCFEQKLDIFVHIFNIFFTMNDPSFFTLQQFCQNIFRSVFIRLKLTEYKEFSQCSEVMLAFLYSNVPQLLPRSKSWHSITRMLYSCLSGIFDLNSIELNSESNKWHMLYRYEILVKTAYYFNLEMSRHSTQNLASITKSYADRWINRASPHDEKVSPFEKEMIKMLLQYLKFNNFDKLISDLINTLKSKDHYHECLTSETDLFLCSALMDLQMVKGVTEMRRYILESECNLQTAKLETLIHILRCKMQLFVWEDDLVNFEKLFICQLPLLRSELFDVDNKTKMPVSSYLKILLFNVELLGAASKLQISNNCMVNGIIEAKRALKLCVCLLKKIDKISQNSRLRLIKLLSFAYMGLIETYIHIGIARDCEFYVKELSKVISELSEPTMVFVCLHYLFEYYKFTEQSELAKTALKQSNNTFNFIDGESNIWGLTLFLYDNGEYEKIGESLRIFFNSDLSKTFLLNYWRLKMGFAINDSECPAKYKSQNDINNLSLRYQRIVVQLETDPFFKSMFDSIIAVPSCQNFEDDPKCNLRVSHKLHLTANVNASPRSSSMTPKGKHMKQKFDRAAAIDNLEKLKHLMEVMNLECLKNYELSQVASFFSFTLFLLSSVCPKRIGEIDLTKELAFSDLPRYMPLYHDKNLINVNSEIYGSFDLLPMNKLASPVLVERERLFHVQENFEKCDLPFNVITIDVSAENESLLLSKIESKFGRRLNLRVPLNRAYARDLDSYKLTFHDAREELMSIIEESNNSTSIEVTNKIKTKEERRKWWETRYDLDRRLNMLLQNIEHYWFSSLKGMFNPVIIKPGLLDEFALKVNEILHQNLPSRKQYGDPSMFTQIDSWIIELMLKLNPQDDHFAFMMEDLLYFVLDILLFQGEENAYDEIDFGGLHFHLEEQIRRFRARLRDHDQSVHTFLIVGSACHIFPWECLSFMNSTSISRIPSYASLNDLLKKYNYNLSPEVSLSSKISIILNPQGDLSRTESRFLDEFSKIVENKKESRLLVNCKPDEITFLNMLSLSNVFVYLGHGGGEQYARLKEIKKCGKIAPSFLLGCSSASKKFYQNLESTGTIYSYLLGGCPLALGNLWDVTDKDIDKFSESMLKKIKFFHNGNDVMHNDSSFEEETSVCLAVSYSRDVCHLKYLNGAAPVVYGLPVKFV